MPWNGENAIDKLINGYVNIKKLFPRIDKNNYWKPTLNIGAINAGDVPNKVPNHAEMLLDIRFTEKENANDLLNKIKKIFKGSRVEVMVKGNVFYTPDKNKYLERYIETVYKITRKNPKLSPTFGAMDARYFSKKNIPVIINQPICGNTHADNEWIDIKSMEDYYNVLVEFVGNMPK
jgi:acetylornithine deacetylase/succinyl-diaminopimelate desuccinylase-like protein